MEVQKHLLYQKAPMRPNKSKAPVIKMEGVEPEKTTSETKRALVANQLQQTKTKRLILQGKPYQDQDDKRRILFLDCKIGELLLQLDDMK